MKNLRTTKSNQIAKMPQKHKAMVTKYKDKHLVNSSVIKVAKKIISEHEHAFEVLGNG